MPISHLFYLLLDYGRLALARNTLCYGTHITPTLSVTPNREMSFVDEDSNGEKIRSDVALSSCEI